MRDAARDLFVDGLRNAHAMEIVALQLLEGQSGRMGDFPELDDQISRHLQETRGQIRRLNACLTACGVTASAAASTPPSDIAGLLVASSAMAGDEILMQTFAHSAFANFEIAAYRSLIVLCEEAGYGDCRAMLEQSLAEAERIAEWIARNIERITVQSVTRRSNKIFSRQENHRPFRDKSA